MPSQIDNTLFNYKMETLFRNLRQCTGPPKADLLFAPCISKAEQISSYLQPWLSHRVHSKPQSIHFTTQWKSAETQLHPHCLLCAGYLYVLQFTAKPDLRDEHHQTTPMMKDYQVWEDAMHSLLGFGVGLTTLNRCAYHTEQICCRNQETRLKELNSVASYCVLVPGLHGATQSYGWPDPVLVSLAWRGRLNSSPPGVPSNHHLHNSVFKVFVQLQLQCHLPSC